jgi:hypothetical protein
MLHWADLQEHHSLNDIYSLASNQRRIFQAMGIETAGDPDNVATENIEELFRRGFLGFLIGQHVGSPFEIWVFLVCVVVTGRMIYGIIRCIWRCKRNGGRSWFGNHRNGYFVAVIDRIRRRKSENEYGTLEPPGPSAPGDNEGTDASEEISLQQIKQIYPKLTQLLQEETVNMVKGSFLVPLKLEGVSVKGLWDTGSSISLISLKTAKKVRAKMESSNIRATSVTGHPLPMTGQTWIHVKLGDRTIRHKFGVMDGEAREDVLLGTDYMMQLGAYLVDLEKKEIQILSGNRLIGVPIISATD